MRTSSPLNSTAVAGWPDSVARCLSACIALLSLGVLAPAGADAQQPESHERLKQLLERHPEADANKDGTLTREEWRAYNRERRDEQNRQRGEQARVPEPTHADVEYGDHPRQSFDLWLAETDDARATPLVIYIHGGGFRGGDKQSARNQPVTRYLEQGISFASMNYRLSDVGPYPMQMHDAARGLQFIRSKAGEWKLDPDRIACYGGSAGAGISLWLAFHDDLADPDAADPVARQSTRIVAAGTQDGQSTYDLRTYRAWFEVPNLKMHPALTPFYAVKDDADWGSDRVKELMRDASPITHLTKDDAPVFMTYGRGDVPVDENSDPGLWVHHVRLGNKLREAMDRHGIECHVVSPGKRSDDYADLHEFLARKVKGGKGED